MNVFGIIFKCLSGGRTSRVVWFLEYESPILATKFKKLKVGAHKADLFRYVILYKYGGIYLDIKTDLIKPISSFINHNVENILYTVKTDACSIKSESKLNMALRMFFNIKNGCIYQGFIATTPGNTILYKLINHFVKSIYVDINYHFSIARFYDLLRLEYNENVKEGEYNKDGKKLVLFVEKNIQLDKDAEGDWRGGHWKIFDNNNKRLFNTRFTDYPW